MFRKPLLLAGLFVGSVVLSSAPKSAQASYPNYCFSLNVPFLVQYPPGDKANTKNCGQACAVMLGGYYNNGQVNSSIITSENSWLYNYTGDSRYLDPNGWYTSGSKLPAFQQLLLQYHGLQSTVRYGNHPDDVVMESANGNPPIAGVMISGGVLCSSGGVGHWVLVVGWDGVHVILNDPGTVNGNHISRYTVADFEASWATSGKQYLSLHR